MSTITPTLNYVDGQVLDTEGHSRNIYDTAYGKGIMSENNGGLADTNLATGFAADASHIYPEAVVRGRQASQTETLDFMPNGMGNLNETGSAVSGTSIRIYVPHDVSAILWQWSAFVSAFRHVSIDSGSGAASAEIILTTQLNGSSIGHARRVVPTTVLLNGTTGAKAKEEAEKHSTLHYDIAHLQTGVSKGWYEFSAALYMENEPAVIFTVGSGAVSVSSLLSRATFGIRNARALVLT